MVINKKLIIGAIAILIIGIAAFMLLNKTNNMAKQVLLETSQGDITLELYNDMPVTAGNFEKLVKSGFYDGDEVSADAAEVIFAIWAVGVKFLNRFCVKFTSNGPIVKRIE